MATIEQQRALAIMQMKRRRAEQGSNVPSPAMAFANREIANVFGAPVDLATAGINAVISSERQPLTEAPGFFPENPFKSISRLLGATGIGSALRGVGAKPITDPVGGSQSIQSLMSDANIAVPREGEQPVGLAPRIAQGVGGAAAALIPGLGAAKALSAGKGVAGAIGRDLVSSVVKRPGVAIGTELASGAGSGFGGTVAEQLAPGNATAGTIGEILGGILAPGVGLINPTRLAGKAGVELAEKFSIPFTKAGAAPRAAKRLKTLVADPEAAAARIDEPTIADISPARRTGDEGLIGLEEAVGAGDVKIAAKLRKDREAGIETLHSEVKKIRGEGVVGETQEGIAKRRGKIVNLIDDRIKEANDAVEAKIQKLAPNMREAQASTVAREELDKALSEARKSEKILWREIPENVLVEKNNTVKTYEEILADTPRAQSEDVPNKLMNKFLAQPKQEKLNIVNERGEPILGPKAPVTERLTELQGLRSKLLEEARNARFEGKFNKARIHDKIADSVLEDMGAAAGRVEGPIGQKIRDALDFSSLLNQKFTRGEVGKVLGISKTGGDKVAPELTLGKLLGRGDVKGDVAVKELLEAADTPELRGSVEDLMKDRLEKAAIKDGKVNPAAARKFAETNRDILEKFPDLKKSIADLSESTEKFTAKVKRGEAVKKTLTSDSKDQVSKFINAPVDKEFDVIVASRDPAAFAKDLVERAAKDKTGKAQKGLKASAVDYLIGKSSKGDVLSGTSMLDNLNNNPRLSKALSEVLSPDEMQRLKRIGGELKKLQAKSLKLSGGVIDDAPSKLMESFLRIKGVQAGRAVGAGGIQEGNIISGRVKDFFGKMTNKKAHEVLVQAVQDPQLMKALLTDATTAKGRKIATTRMEAWLLGPGTNLLNDQKEE